MDISNILSKEILQVNKLIVEKLASDIELIGMLGKHLILAGGKRVRPILTIASAKICNYSGIDHITLATSVEFIHTATLLHDDVVDSSSLRRGRKTANTLWGNQSSVLVGDFLFSRAFQLMTEVGNIKVLSELANASKVISEGEVMQLVYSENLNMNEDIYYKIISTKTAALFASACKVGAVIAKADNNRIKNLFNYGYNLGVCFQIIDDVLDYNIDAKSLGKNTGDDVKEKIITLPIIHCYKNIGTKGKKILEDIFYNKVTYADEFEKVKKLLSETKSIEYALLKAETYAEQAKNSITSFDNSILKKELIKLVDFCSNRKN